MSMARQALREEITPGQIKKIHTMISLIGFADETYRDMLWINWRVKSSKELTTLQAGKLIEDLEKFAVKHGYMKKNDFPAKYKTLQDRPGFASIAQLILIRGLWDKVSRMETPESKAKALRGFLFKVARVSDLRFLNKSGASKVIIALRAMEKKQTEKGSVYENV